jgi:hypothetical protein
MAGFMIRESFNIEFFILETRSEMNEREIVKSILDFSFLVKGHLKSDETALLRSVLNIVIMEAEDIIYNMSNIDQEMTDIIETMSRNTEKRA